MLAQLVGVLVEVDRVRQVLLDKLSLVALPVLVEEVDDLGLLDLHGVVIPAPKGHKQDRHPGWVVADSPSNDADRDDDDRNDADLDVDVAVVGAGPAGAAAALAVLAARPGARVALLDRAAFPRDKACGDGVAPQVLDVLGRLGVRGLLDDWPGVDLLELGYPGGAWLRGQMNRPNYVVPRKVLDVRLVEAAVDRGAMLLQRRVRDLARRNGRLAADGVRARIVIGADGASSAVRSWLRTPGGGHTAIALRGYAPVSVGRQSAQVIAFDPQGAWPAYAWSFPIGDGMANVGYGEILPTGGRADEPGPTRAHLVERLDTLLPGAAEHGSQWRGHHLPLSTTRWRQPDGPVLLAGDALGLVNPLTGEGIHAAVLSGAYAGLAAAWALRVGTSSAAGAKYRAALAARFGRHWRHMALLAAATRRHAGGETRQTETGGGRGRRLVVAALAAGGRDQRVFDDLAELGLAEGPLTARAVTGLVRQLVPELLPARGSGPSSP
jgi:geranylgeranyl reductase family protein